MSKPAFTPGPWRTDEFTYESVIGPDGIMVADCSIFVSPKFGERSAQTNRANARVIAAVPDMVEALRNLADVARGYIGHMDEEDIVALENARAALAKALGESSHTANGA